MKFQLHQKLIIITLLLSRIVQNKKKCDVKLLQSFRLHGLQYSVADKMKICPHVQERCCTLMDQLSILNLWNQTGRPSIKQYNDQVMNGYSTLLNQIDLFIQELKEEDITIHYIQHKWVPFLKHYCLGNSLQRNIDPQISLKKLPLIVPGKGKITKVYKLQKDIMEMKFDKMLDKNSVEVYLALLSFANRQNFKYSEVLKKIYLNEIDIDSIDVRKIIFKNVDFEEEKLQFLKFVNKVIEKINNFFQSTLKKYRQRMPVSKIKSISSFYSENYEVLLKNIREFMKLYNKIHNPQKRYIFLHAFSMSLKEEAAILFSFICKLKKQMKDSVLQEKIKIKEEKDQENDMDIRKNLKRSYRIPKLDNLVPFQQEGELFEQQRSYDTENDLLKGTNPNSIVQNIINDKQSSKKELPIDFAFSENQRKLLKNDKNERKLFFKFKQNKFWNQLHSEFDSIPIKIRNIKRIYQTDKIRIKKKPIYYKRNKDQLGLKDKLPFLSRREFLRRKKLFRKKKKYYKKEFIKHMSYAVKQLKIPSTIFEKKQFQVPMGIFQKKIIQCNLKGRHLYKSLLHVNKDKMQYCYTHFKQLKLIDLNIIRGQLKKIQISNYNILNLKKSLYCSICDVNQQKLIHNPRQIIVLEQQFCQQMINKHHIYLRWMHIQMIELLDKLYQTVRCFETKGNVSNLPFKSYLDKYKRKIYFINRCLESRESSDFMMHCHFICKEYKLQKFSKFWEGDLDMISNMIFKFYSFAKRQQMHKIDTVEPMSWVFDIKVNRDYQRKIQKKGKGQSKYVKNSLKKDKKYDELVKSVKYKVSKNDLDTKSVFSDFSSKIPKLDERESNLFKNACNFCMEGPKGKLCRLKFCQLINPCQLCMKGIIGEKCRITHCEFYKLQAAKFKSTELNLKKPIEDEVKKMPGMYQIIPSITRVKIIKEKVRSRKLKKTKKQKIQQKKENQNNRTQQQEDVTMLDMRRVLQGNRILSEQQLKDQIYKKRFPLYDIQSFHTFYSQTVPALNPLKIIHLINFENFYPDDLIKQQFKETNSEQIIPNVVKDYLNFEQNDIDDFNKDAFIDPVQVIKGPAMYVKKSIRDKVAAIKQKGRVKNDKEAMELVKPKKIIKKPSQPDYQYILNDVTKDSNDPMSRIFLAKFHKVYKTPKDPKDFVKHKFQFNQIKLYHQFPACQQFL